MGHCDCGFGELPACQLSASSVQRQQSTRRVNRLMAQTNSKSEEVGEQQSAVAHGNSQPACCSQQQDVRGSRSAWFTKWTSIPLGPIPHITTRPDYRSRLPPRVQEVAAQFRPLVQDGQWTTGLFECWFHKHRHAGRLESSLVKLCYRILSCPNNRMLAQQLITAYYKGFSIHWPAFTLSRCVRTGLSSLQSTSLAGKLAE